MRKGFIFLLLPFLLILNSLNATAENPFMSGQGSSPYGDILNKIKRKREPQKQQSSPSSQTQKRSRQPKTPSMPSVAPPLSIGTSQTTERHVTSATTGQQPPVTAIKYRGHLPPQLKKIGSLRQQIIENWYFHSNCTKADALSRKLIQELTNLYSSKNKLSIPGDFTVVLVLCRKTRVVWRESGYSFQPESWELKYQVVTQGPIDWYAVYIFSVADRKGVFDGFGLKADNTKLLSEQRIKSINFTGWRATIRNQQVVRAALDRYRYIPGLPLFMGGNAQKGHPVDSAGNRNITGYFLSIPPEQIVFTPSNGDPQDFVSSCAASKNITLQKNDLSKVISRGVLHLAFKGVDTGLCKADIEIKIDIPNLGCKGNRTSGRGAIATSADCIDHGGYIMPNEDRVFVNGKPVARVGDRVFCLIHGITEIVGDKSNTVSSRNRKIARVGDKTKCGATIMGGSESVFIGNSR